MAGEASEWDRDGSICKTRQSQGRDASRRDAFASTLRPVMHEGRPVIPAIGSVFGAAVGWYLGLYLVLPAVVAGITAAVLKRIDWRQPRDRGVAAADGLLSGADALAGLGPEGPDA